MMPRLRTEISSLEHGSPIAMMTWAVSYDTLQPNPALTQHPVRTYEGTDPAAPGGPRAGKRPLVLFERMRPRRTPVGEGAAQAEG